MYNGKELDINKEIKKHRNYELLLTELRGKRKFALAGTIGCVALICTNMQLVSDTNFALATTSVVALPYIASYFSTIQSKINDAIIEKKACEHNIEDYREYRAKTYAKQYVKTK